MTSGLAERKERRFGTRRTPNTITVPINWRRDCEEGKESLCARAVHSRFLGALHFAPTWGRRKPDRYALKITETKSQHFTSRAFPPPFFTRENICVVCLDSRAEFCETFPPLKSDRRALFQLLPPDLSNAIPSSCGLSPYM